MYAIYYNIDEHMYYGLWQMCYIIYRTYAGPRQDISFGQIIEEALQKI